MTPTFSIAVYCGSRTGVNPEFVTVAQQVGTWIGARGGRLVYGGGDVGLMGVVASSTLAAGGTVLGVIPQILMDKEVAKRDCTELIVVPTMHERKALMMQHADAFLALPGGIGTLEELFEVWTWAQLGYHNKPIGLLNTAQFYDGLWRFLEYTVAQGFLSQLQLRTVTVDAQPERLLTQLITQAGLAVANDELATTM